MLLRAAADPDLIVERGERQGVRFRFGTAGWPGAFVLRNGRPTPGAVVRLESEAVPCDRPEFRRSLIESRSAHNSK